MQNKRYKARVDKLYYIIFIPTLFLVLGEFILFLSYPPASIILFPVLVTVIALAISPIFAYAELREDSLFIKYGFCVKKEIPYSKIRGLKVERRWYSESMVSMKYAMDHIVIKYNRFDNTTISVVDENEFVEKILSKNSLIIEEK